MEQSSRSLGIDIGSTTTKLVFMADGNIIYEKYQRHLSRARQTALEMLREIEPLLREGPFTAAISGSAGLGIAEAAGLDFVQEVYATSEFISRKAPDTSVIIELGGEDAKVVFYRGGVDQRMNGSCAGGTGAFIDQMAVLLDMSLEEMDRQSLEATQIYPIASRCGVFAKTDIQPLLNQGAKKSDVAASIYQAVVNQVISGLVQGRRIEGKVMFLGGPLHYCKGLRRRFVETLHLTEENAVFPEYDRFAVAMGAAMYSSGAQLTDFDTLVGHLENAASGADTHANRLPPLFADEAEYAEFSARHASADIPRRDISTYLGKAWVGIDCGSTTTKLVLISEDKEILYSWYSPNQGNPIDVVRPQLMEIRRLCGDRIEICGSAVTGYGEELIKNAFHVDEGVVETIAHFRAARHFQPEVDFILDIGGQDIKCFRIRNGAIDSIMLNEACSSGCGSFIETFAKSMGYEVADFAKLGLFADAPVNLGSRCTVFMNSSVKQSQKDGVSVENISAGLSISVVKNAIYKVIRASSPSELGQHIVVQGGTLCNDAVLRAFEKELGVNVVRPVIAGLMGAYGAALISMRYDSTTLLSSSELEAFTHRSASAVCQGCANHCRLTINTFADGKRFISGNQCQRGAGKLDAEELPNIYEWKRRRLQSLQPVRGKRGRIGMPMALSFFELAPLWHGLFTSLGFEVCFSPLSTRATYEKGQFTIPSDTICYPAKIMHGHIEQLLDQGFTAIFCPCATYNVDEHAGQNHYNCPVVAYYGEVLNGNMEQLKDIKFLHPYISLDDPKSLAATLLPALQRLDPSITRRQLIKAAKDGFAAYESYKADLKKAGEEAVEWARSHGKRIMILAGRPYHVDPEIGHGIDKLANTLGFAVVSEDSVCHLADPQSVKVLDQWTFHSRLYRAAGYACKNDDVELVQLVSFGCGVDAITTDEVREILESGGKHYTQIKIDEITNLGAVKVRLRSLIGALEEKGENDAGRFLHKVHAGDEKGLHDTRAQHASGASNADSQRNEDLRV